MPLCYSFEKEVSGRSIPLEKPVDCGNQFCASYPVSRCKLFFRWCALSLQFPELIFFRRGNPE